MFLKRNFFLLKYFYIYRYLLTLVAKPWIRIHIRLKSWIRIGLNVMLVFLVMLNLLGQELVDVLKSGFMGALAKYVEVNHVGPKKVLSLPGPPRPELAAGQFFSFATMTTRQSNNNIYGHKTW